MKILLVTLGEKLGFAMEILNYIAIIFDAILLLCFSWFYIYYIVNGFKKETDIKATHHEGILQISFPKEDIPKKTSKNITVS